MTTEREEATIIEAEGEAWQDMCRELRALGIELNDTRANVAIRTICFWGEHLVRLRGCQSKELRAKAMQEKTESMCQARNEAKPAADPSRRDTEDLKCPKCGSVDDFAIEIASTRYFDADGMYDTAPCEGDFYGANLCMCQADDCGHEGTVFDFLPKAEAPATA